MIDEVINDAGIAQPASFHQVKRRGIIEIRIRLARPRDVVEELEDGCALPADLADMSTQ